MVSLGHRVLLDQLDQLGLLDHLDRMDPRACLEIQVQQEPQDLQVRLEPQEVLVILGFRVRLALEVYQAPKAAQGRLAQMDSKGNKELKEQVAQRGTPDLWVVLAKKALLDQRELMVQMDQLAVKEVLVQQGHLDLLVKGASRDCRVPQEFLVK